MSIALRAPSCTITRSLDSVAVDGVFDELEGRCEAPLVFYDGGSDSNRYVFIGEMSGDLTISDIEFDYSSSSASALNLTTDDVILTTTNSVAISINYGGTPVLIFDKCSSRFAVPDLKEEGDIVMARGKYSYRIWDPDSEPVTL